MSPKGKGKGRLRKARGKVRASLSPKVSPKVRAAKAKVGIRGMTGVTAAAARAKEKVKLKEKGKAAGVGKTEVLFSEGAATILSLPHHCFNVADHGHLASILCWPPHSLSAMYVVYNCHGA
mmetsp:Transcript_76362/g.119291  ORF Transcript_76362/g.119291 Transcript_76362/m.119291 type:complete len:121 (-) Transcript_76362:183-545(-)